MIFLLKFSKILSLFDCQSEVSCPYDQVNRIESSKYNLIKVKQKVQHILWEIGPVREFRPLLRHEKLFGYNCSLFWF